MLTYIYLLVQASSFLVCIYLFKYLKDTLLKYFLPFLLITLTVELVGFWLTKIGIKNYLLYNVFTTLEFIFYSFLFSKHLKTTLFKKLTLGFMPFYATMVFLNLQFIQGYNSFHTYTFLLGSFFIVLFCCLFFYESVLPEHLDHPLAKQPFFWVCTGLLLFYMGSVIINALFEYLRSYDLQEEGKRIYGIINQSLNVVLYSAFIYAFILCRKNKKTYSSQ
ncbi:MAG: hypothetical protein C0446_02360 [Chitinophaga sp.]|nr:hypothetical protein [Chitinophaga sp.]